VMKNAATSGPTMMPRAFWHYDEASFGVSSRHYGMTGSQSL
jgi:hypothetical protein